VRSLTFRAKNGGLKLGEKTALMGVVNVTPDSFYAGSRHLDPDHALALALKLVEAGADIVDIGGESTRPGASPIDVEEEIRRVVPVVARLRPLSRVLISVDTRHAAVAERALDAGAEIVNDVSALGDSRMAEVVARAKAGLVLMHMKGTPSAMQVSPSYRDAVAEVKEYLASAIEKAESSGVSSDSILVDPGIGFGKTLEHNLTLLHQLSSLAELSKPILVGTSRKSFIGRILSGTAARRAGTDDEERLFGTAASVACAVILGASAVRVHDVREMRLVVAVADAIKNQGVEGRPKGRVLAVSEGVP
jgi:dihydropteroate synthase